MKRSRSRTALAGLLVVAGVAIPCTAWFAADRSRVDSPSTAREILGEVSAQNARIAARIRAKAGAAARSSLECSIPPNTLTTEAI